MKSHCIPWDLFVHSHTILFYLVLLLYLFVFLGISLYSLRYLHAFAYHSVLLSVPCVFPCIPWNLVVFLRIPWNLVVFLGISLYIRIPFCSTQCSFCISGCSWESRCIPSYSLKYHCIPWNLFVHSHTILFYLVLLLYFLVFLGISLYSFVFLGISLCSLESLCTFAYPSVHQRPCSCRRQPDQQHCAFHVLVDNHIFLNSIILHLLLFHWYSQFSFVFLYILLHSSMFLCSPLRSFAGRCIT